MQPAALAQKTSRTFMYLVTKERDQPHRRSYAGRRTVGPPPACALRGAGTGSPCQRMGGAAPRSRRQGRAGRLRFGMVSFSRRMGAALRARLSRPPSIRDRRRGCLRPGRAGARREGNDPMKCPRWWGRNREEPDDQHRRRQRRQRYRQQLRGARGRRGGGAAQAILAAARRQGDQPHPARHRDRCRCAGR